MSERDVMDLEKKLHGRIDVVMHSPVVTIDRDATLRSATIALRDAGTGTLAVMDGSIAAGILSERDIVHALADGANPDQVRVLDVMSKEPRYLTAGEDVSAAVDVMLEVGVRHLPVLDEGDVVGIVSMRDLMGVLRS
jgi:CBS domain-containing protein